VELIHPGVSDLDRETPFGNSTGILGVVVAQLLCAGSGFRSPLAATLSAASTNAECSNQPELVGVALRLAESPQIRAPVGVAADRVSVRVSAAPPAWALISIGVPGSPRFGDLSEMENDARAQRPRAVDS
jgi:hypothetical protein